MGVQRGDILMYYGKYTFIDDAIKFGELLEDGSQPKEYYHVAIALSPTEKIEANGIDVTRAPIETTPNLFDYYRLPGSKEQIETSLSFIERFIGEKYDWTLIADDVLMYATDGLIHLPEALIEKRESSEKICSTLGELYMVHRGFISSRRYDSPEDVYIDIRNFAELNPE